MREQPQERESQKKAIEQLNNAQKLAHNAIQVGISTVHALEDQSETLDGTEQLLSANEDLISQSMRVLRGMTWSGSLYNVYSDISGSLSGTISTAKPENSQSSKGKEERDGEPAPLRYHAKFAEPAPSANSTLLRDAHITASPRTQEEAALEDISSALETIKGISMVMGERLQHQNEQLDRIDALSDRVHDNTLTVTLKSTKLSKTSSSREGDYVGTFQFFTSCNGEAFVLATEGTCLILSRSADPNTLFRCFVRQGTLLGLQSEVTGKFLGCTIWGGVAVAGEYFGSQEECVVDLKGDDSGILLVARNWGAGGWLKLDDAAIKAMATSEERIEINATTTAITDRANMLVFKAVKCR